MFKAQTWHSSRRPEAGQILLITGAVAISLIAFNLLLSGEPPAENRIAVFSNVANYSLQVLQTGNGEYTGLLEALEPLGSVTANGDSKHWKLRYNRVEIGFTVGKTRVQMKGGDFDLGSPFVLQNGRGLVPVASLGPLLSRILGGPVTFNSDSRRIFIGNVAIHFTAQVVGATPPSLVINFSGPVNPMIATDAGTLRMTFIHEPIVASGTQTLTFNNKVITSATYQDGNNSAAITVAGSTPLFAHFSGDHKTITITPAPSASQQAQAPAAPLETTNAVQPTASTKSAYFAVIDAGHGGADRGAALGGQMVEKDVTLVFARQLQHEIETRGLTALLIRSDDTDISLDQRAGLTNAIHPSIYICIHVTSQGSGVNFYTALLPTTTNTTHGPFLDWDTAQASSLARSQGFMAIVANSFRNSKIRVRTLSAPLRPLNNITTVAVAIEVASPAGGPSGIDSPEYQQLIASTIATGLAEVHEETGSSP